MKIFKTEENFHVAHTLESRSLVYSRNEEYQKAIDIMEKVYSTEPFIFNYYHKSLITNRYPKETLWN